MSTTSKAPGERHSTLSRVRPTARRNLVGWLFLAPALAIIAVFTLAPFGQAILLSFQQWDGVSADTPFVGLLNYQTALSNLAFLESLRNVVVFGVAGFFIGNGLALLMAILVDRAPRARTFFRTAFYLPTVFSVVVVGMIWAWMLQPKVGVVNGLLEGLGLGGLAQNWLGDPNWSLVSVAAVFIWYHWGFAFILFLAGLQDVPRELYEAASLDGCRGWGKFRYVTWPALAPVTSIVSLLTLLAALQIFGTVQVLTNGGPGYHTMVPTLVIYQEAFSNYRYGSAAAMSVLFGGALVLISLVQLAVTNFRSRRR